MGLPCYAGYVVAPGEVVSDVHAQVFEAGDHLNCCSSDEEGTGVVAPQDASLGGTSAKVQHPVARG